MVDITQYLELIEGSMWTAIRNESSERLKAKLGIAPDKYVAESEFNANQQQYFSNLVTYELPKVSRDIQQLVDEAVKQHIDNVCNLS